jgi:EAL domain-containing protein (putative c-di-GMP-specific phosphodiesterase class I)
MVNIEAGVLVPAREVQCAAASHPAANLAIGAARREARHLRREILAGLAAREFPLQFQPRFAIASPRVTAVEGVVRWQHRRRGAISEAALMALAEKAGATPELQRWAFAAGCEALAGLPGGIRLALNLTAWQVRHPGLSDAIDTALRQHDLRADQLELTLSETALETLDPEAQLMLAGLFDEGISLAVGQFGSQLGSLTLLSRFPLERVKLDARLARRVPGDPDARAVVSATVAVAHAMGARVVAAGVETEAQRAALAGLGCDEATGSFYGQAVPGGQLVNIVV